LITMEDPTKLQALADRIAKEGLSAREVERLVKDKKPAPKKEGLDTDYRYAERLLTNKLQTRVKIAPKQVTISFDDDDDLNRLLEIIGALED
jgi:ParB family transcriptional regulator, chromosome partitioning protein